MNKQQTNTEAVAAAGAPGSNAPGSENPGANGTGQVTESQVQGTEQQTVATPPPAPSGISREDIEAIVTSAVTAVTPKQEPKQLSQEEIDRELRVFRPSVKHVEALQAGGEPALQALGEIVQGVYQQAVTMAAYQMQMQLQQVNGQLTPISQFVAEQRQEQLKGDFFKTYPDLKEYEPILLTVRDQLMREGAKFKDTKSAFLEVATRARNLLKSLPVNAAPAGGNGQTAGTAPTNRMSTLTGGGQGGAGGNGGSAKPPVNAGMAALM